MGVAVLPPMYSAICAAIMVYKIIVMTRAERDLRLLYLAIDAQNSKQASAWYYGLEALILSLDTNPERGSIASEKSGVRQLLYKSKSYHYRILYRIDEKRRAVQVLHIRHGARQKG